MVFCVLRMPQSLFCDVVVYLPVVGPVSPRTVTPTVSFSLTTPHESIEVAVVVYILPTVSEASTKVLPMVFCVLRMPQSLFCDVVVYLPVVGPVSPRTVTPTVSFSLTTPHESIEVAVVVDILPSVSEASTKVLPMVFCVLRMPQSLFCDVVVYLPVVGPVSPLTVTPTVSFSLTTPHESIEGAGVVEILPTVSDGSTKVRPIVFCVLRMPQSLFCDVVVYLPVVGPVSPLPVPPPVSFFLSTPHQSIEVSVVVQIPPTVSDGSTKVRPIVFCVLRMPQSLFWLVVVYLPVVGPVSPLTVTPTVSFILTTPHESIEVAVVGEILPTVSDGSTKVRPIVFCVLRMPQSLFCDVVVYLPVVGPVSPLTVTPTVSFILTTPHESIEVAVVV